jgi:hypothetical protein
MAADLRALAVAGAAPDPMFGAGALLHLELGDGPLLQQIRIGARYAISDTTDVSGGGSARFVLAAATIEECPARVRLGDFALAPCVQLDVGALGGQGYIANARSDAKPWVDVGAFAEGRWAIGRTFFVLAKGGLIVPLTKVRYHFDNPDVSIHTAAAIGGAAEIGAGLYFW